MAVNETSQGQSGRPESSLDGGGHQYTQGYPHTTTHEYDPGVLVLPVASSTSKVVKVRVHGGYSIRRVAFDVVRNNNPPIIPKPEDIVGDKRTDYLTACTISTPLPIETNTTGGLQWKVMGEYTFVTAGKTDADPAARVPGEDLLPLGGYPYPLGLVDSIGNAALTLTGGNLQAYSDLQIPLVATDQHVWPFTSLPPYTFNPDLLQGE